ncbi:MAG: hypothetical protein L3J51_01545 [Cocleimonas sp.]|nr:hypothetical protein [Cocleimonas sp.]
MKTTVFWLFLIAITWWYVTKEDKVILGAGVRVTDAPYQSKIRGIKPFQFKGSKITPLANIDLRAKVLSKENYSFDEGAKISPVDLALGWQNMSDEDVLKNIEISQSGRFYRWHVNKFPIPRNEIQTQSANMHMIPASSIVESAFKKIKKGQIISLSGYLVRVDTGSRHWISSLTRKDTGAGACEVIYVNHIDIVN